MSGKLQEIIKSTIHQYNLEYGSPDLRYSRILFFSLFLVLGFPDFSGIINNDPAWFNPPMLSPAYFIGRIPSEIFLKALSILTILSALCQITGLWLRVSGIIFLIAFITGTSLYFSFGKVDHSDIFVPVVAFLLLLNTWKNGKFLSPGSVYFLLSFAIATAFFTAGITKLLSGWLLVSDQQLKYIIINYSIGLERGILGPLMLDKIHYKFIWESLDWVAVLFELSLFIFIFKPKWIRWVILFCMVFHLFNAYTMGIYFKPIMLVYLFILPLSDLWREHKKWIGWFFLFTVLIVLVHHSIVTGAVELINAIKSNYSWLWLSSAWYIFLLILYEIKPIKEV